MERKVWKQGMKNLSEYMLAMKYMDVCQRETRVKELEKVGNIIPGLLEEVQVLKKKYEEEIIERGNTLKELCEKYWQEHQLSDMDNERSDRCLTLLRAVQAEARVRPWKDVEQECFLRKLGYVENCLDCNAFVEATEDQIKNSLHVCDIDTGEPDKIILKKIEDE